MPHFAGANISGNFQTAFASATGTGAVSSTGVMFTNSSNAAVWGLIGQNLALVTATGTGGVSGGITYHDGIQAITATGICAVITATATGTTNQTNGTLAIKIGTGQAVNYIPTVTTLQTASAVYTISTWLVILGPA